MTTSRSIDPQAVTPGINQSPETDGINLNSHDYNLLDAAGINQGDGEVILGLHGIKLGGRALFLLKQSVRVHTMEKWQPRRVPGAVGSSTPSTSYDTRHWESK